MSYAYYPGCVIPLQTPNYEVSARAVLKAFDIPIVDIEDFGCCGILATPLDGFTTLTFAARNIALAEAKGSKAAHQLEDEETRGKVNRILKEVGLNVQGKTKVHHFHQILYDKVGVNEIQRSKGESR